VTDQPPQEGELILYRTADDAVRVEVLYESETFWLDQRRMAELFGVDVRTVNEHLRNIFASGELSEEATLRKIRIVRTEGSREVARDITFYNLDAIISVGYRVNSAQATQFRIWATQTLREFIIKGFVLDDERLKLNKRFGRDYFDELLERIREIRASERRFYLKITDIYEQCSIDYDKHAETTQTFFKTVQNKLHWAVTGKTAAELIAERADAEKPSMGAHHVDERAQGEDPQERCQRRQELPDRARDQGAGAHRVNVPRLCREPGRPTDPDEDGRMGRKARRLPAVQRVRGARERRKGLCGGGQASGRRAVR